MTIVCILNLVPFFREVSPQWKLAVNVVGLSVFVFALTSAIRHPVTTWLAVDEPRRIWLGAIVALNLFWVGVYLPLGALGYVLLVRGRLRRTAR
jgi:hypothetical protein